MTIAAVSQFDQKSLRKTIDAFRSAGTRAPTSDFDIPPDLATAESIQRTAALSGDVSDAWKVAKSPTGVPVVSRLHPFIASSSSGSLLWRTGTLLEIEVAMRLKQDLPPGPQYDRVDIVNASNEFFVGAELVRSVALENGKASFPLFLADRMGNDGYCLGPAFPAGLLDQVQFADLKIQLESDTLFQGKARHANGDCLGWLVEFASLSTRDPHSLKSGTVVKTGSLCGATEVPKPGRVTVSVAPHISFQFPILD